MIPLRHQLAPSLMLVVAMCRAAIEHTLIFTENKMRISGFVALLFLCLPIHAKADDYNCEKDVHVVDACFNVHGRVRIEANSRITLWPSGSKRLLGVQYPGDMPGVGGDFVPLPKNLAAILNSSTAVFGNYLVCPFTKSEAGKKRYVCIATAEHLISAK